MVTALLVLVAVVPVMLTLIFGFEVARLRSCFVKVNRRLDLLEKRDEARTVWMQELQARVYVLEHRAPMPWWRRLLGR